MPEGLNPLVTPEPNQGDPGAAEPTSFRERKLAQLQGEPEPDAGRPETLGLESDEDGNIEQSPYHDQPEGDDQEAGQDDEISASDADGEVEEALFEEELPAEDDPDAAEDDEPDEQSADYWKDKAGHLQRELSKVTENRKAIEQEFSDGIQGNITLRHQLEDLTQDNLNRAQFFANMANHTVSQYENMDWSQVEPENMAQMKAAYHQAVQQRDRVMQVFEGAKQAREQSLDTAKRREAEVTRSVLSRRIPNWSKEHHATLRDHAQTLGYSAEEFNQITDWRPILLIHRDWDAAQAVKKVQNIKREQKANKPRNRNARQQPRNSRGRFQQAKDNAFSNPGNKSAFREMKLRQMGRERERGR